MRALSLRTLADTSFAPVAAAVVRTGLTAEPILVAGLVSGLAGAGCIAAHLTLVGLGLISLDFVLAGLAGSVARLTTGTQSFGFLAIVFEFLAAASVPFAFALADPSRAVAAAFLLFGFVVCGSASLGHAALIAGKSATPETAGPFAFHGLAAPLGRGAAYLGAAVACVVPQWFSLAAYAVGALSFAAAGSWVAAALSGDS